MRMKPRTITIMHEMSEECINKTEESTRFRNFRNTKKWQITMKRICLHELQIVERTKTITKFYLTPHFWMNWRLRLFVMKSSGHHNSRRLRRNHANAEKSGRKHSTEELREDTILLFGTRRSLAEIHQLNLECHRVPGIESNCQRNDVRGVAIRPSKIPRPSRRVAQ